MSPTLHIHLLGDFLLVSGDTPVTTVAVPRLQSLLTYLVLHRSAPQDRSRLAFLLWPDSTEAQAHTNLRKLLYQLRQAFPDAGHFLHADKHSLQWQTTPDDPWTLDVLDFEQALAQAEQAKQAQDTNALRQALEQVMHLYRGDLLPSCYDEWILPERDRLRQLFLQAAERLVALLEQERDYDAAIKAAQELLRHDPLHEATYRKLMRLYALRGDRASALRVYHTCVTVLERELAAEPSEATRQAYESLLQSDTSVTPTGPLTSRGTAAPMVGRKEEWQQLQAAWRKAASGHPQMVMLSGEAGIGKTRLAEEMKAWVDRQGMTAASARCYAAEGRLAYAPVTTWLRTDAIQAGLPTLDPIWLTEVARLVPDALAKRSKLPRPASMTEEWQRQHFFEALVRALLSARQPLLLLLDDLQWCDNETLEWLHYLLRFEPGVRLLLTGTVRSEEILPGHPLVAFLGALQRDGLVTEIALRPFNPIETTSLAEHIMGHQLDPATINMLYYETEGNPLFVVEMARTGTLEQSERAQAVAGNPLPLLTQPASTLSPTVQAVLSTRLAQLSPLAHEVANVAAVIGREFTFVVLARASEESEDAVVQALDELWQRRIVREQDGGTAETYDFSHDKLREQAYASLSPAYRHLLHRRVAEALETVYAGDLDAVSAQVAAHYERAGLPGRAIPYYRRAGEVALRIYANAEAVEAFQRAAALLDTGVPGHAQQGQQWEEAAAIHASLGDIFAMTGRQPEARQAYQSALARIPSQESLLIPADNATPVASLRLSQSDRKSIWQARLLRKTAGTWNLASDNPLDTFHVNASQTFQEAERILEQVALKSSTEWVQEWIDLQIDQLLPLRGSVDEMTAIIEKAQAIVEQYGTAEQRGKFFQAVAARDAIRDRYTASEETVAYCRDSLAALQQTGNRSLIGFAHFVLGNRLWWSGHLDEAEKEMHAAIDIAEEIGNTTLLVRCLALLPFVFRQRGQLEEVRGVIMRALAMPEARNIALIKGHRAWIAWRDSNLVEAEVYGRASVEERQGRQGSNAFRWAGLWPVIGVALTREKIAEAIDYVRMLLDPTQQPPSEEVSVLLQAALQAWDAGQPEEARALLQQAVPLAEKMGYL
jgi:DNA-binding SARP family transcriptional activator